MVELKKRKATDKFLKGMPSFEDRIESIIDSFDNELFDSDYTFDETFQRHDKMWRELCKEFNESKYCIIPLDETWFEKYAK